jgi:hypothetical protein
MRKARFLVSVTFIILTMSGLNLAVASSAELDKRIPYVEQRLHSSRWQVRYSLLQELDGRDKETKALLEKLVRDANEHVANQALVRYISNFVIVDKKLFDPDIYLPGKYPLDSLPKDGRNRALVEYCLGRKDIAFDGKIYDTEPAIPVLDISHQDRPEMSGSLTIVGLLGDVEDAKRLHPFLESTNPYVALSACIAVIRLGDKAAGDKALCSLIDRVGLKDGYYTIQALYALREVDRPAFVRLARRILAQTRGQEGIDPSLLNAFLMLAAEADENALK